METLAIVLCAVVPVVGFASDNGFKVAYDGGSIQNAKVGNKLKMYLNPSQIRILKDAVEVATIPVAAITEISYGQDVHRRVGAAIGLASFLLVLGHSCF